MKKIYLRYLIIFLALLASDFAYGTYDEIGYGRGIIASLLFAIAFVVQPNAKDGDA